MGRDDRLPKARATLVDGQRPNAQGPISRILRMTLQDLPPRELLAAGVAPELTAVIDAHPLFAGLSPQERRELAEIARLETVEPGETVLREGEPSETISIIVDGELELLLRATREAERVAAVAGLAAPEEFRFLRLERGEIVGEMSFIDGGPASATVRNPGDAKPCLLLCVDEGALLAAPGETARRLREKILRAAATVVVERLRATSQRQVTSMASMQIETKLRERFTLFFLITIVLFGIAGVVTRLITADLPPLMQMFYSWAFLLLSFQPIAWFVYRQKMPLAWHGLTLDNGKASAARGAAIGLGLGALLVGYRALTRDAAEPFFSWGSVADYTRAEFWAFIALYGPHCFLQELIGRGVIQSSLAGFMRGAPRAMPIIATSMLFAVYHFYVSLSFAAVTFVASVLFGWQYQRDRTLVGVTITHVLLGLASVATGLN